MNSITKTIYRIGISGVIFCFATIIIRILFPIEFINSDLTDTFNVVILFGLPISILLTLLKLLENKVSKHVHPGFRIAATILASVFSFVILLLYGFFSSMCGYIIDDILFKSRNSNEQIVIRHTDCGATDSGDSPRELVRITPIGVLQIYREVDTNTLDTSEWIKP